jgi:hypothetical protein
MKLNFKFSFEWLVFKSDWQPTQDWMLWLSVGCLVAKYLKLANADTIVSDAKLPIGYPRAWIVNAHMTIKLLNINFQKLFGNAKNGTWW